MNYKETQALRDASRGVNSLALQVKDIELEVSSLARRLDAVCDLFDAVLDRRRGRPSEADITEMDRLRTEIRAGAH